MTIGGALFLIAVGAILRYAIVDRSENVNVAALGLILIWIGLIGLIIGVILAVLHTIRGRGGPRVGDRR